MSKNHSTPCRFGRPMNGVLLSMMFLGRIGGVVVLCRDTNVWRRMCDIELIVGAVQWMDGDCKDEHQRFSMVIDGMVEFIEINILEPLVLRIISMLLYSKEDPWQGVFITPWHWE